MSKILRNVMRQWKSREDFLDAVEVPDEAWVHGRGSDIELELPVLWALVRLLRPAVTVELGTRHGVSARTLAHACWQIRGRYLSMKIWYHIIVMKKPGVPAVCDRLRGGD